MFLMLKPHMLLSAANIFVAADGLSISSHSAQLARAAITVQVSALWSAQNCKSKVWDWKHYLWSGFEIRSQLRKHRNVRRRGESVRHRRAWRSWDEAAGCLVTNKMPRHVFTSELIQHFFLKKDLQNIYTYFMTLIAKSASFQLNWNRNNALSIKPTKEQLFLMG